MVATYRHRRQTQKSTRTTVEGLLVRAWTSDPPESLVKEALHAKCKRIVSTELPAHLVGEGGHVGSQTPRVEEEGLGEGVEEVLLGLDDKAGDATLVLFENDLQVRGQRARGGQAG